LPVSGNILYILHIWVTYYAVIIFTSKILLINCLIHKNRYRNRIEIVCLILQVVNGGATKKTEMMYKANISYTQLKQYVTVLTESDLLRYDYKTHAFKTTEKGLRFLEAYNQMNHILKEK
jgi:predicted transcriptional regulator